LPPPPRLSGATVVFSVTFMLVHGRGHLHMFRALTETEKKTFFGGNNDKIKQNRIPFLSLSPSLLSLSLSLYTNLSFL
jgi:hypothetical protein